MKTNETYNRILGISESDINENINEDTLIKWDLSLQKQENVLISFKKNNPEKNEYYSELLRNVSYLRDLTRFQLIKAGSSYIR